MDKEAFIGIQTLLQAHRLTCRKQEPSWCGLSEAASSGRHVDVSITVSFGTATNTNVHLKTPIPMRRRLLILNYQKSLSSQIRARLYGYSPKSNTKSVLLPLVYLIRTRSKQRCPSSFLPMVLPPSTSPKEVRAQEPASPFLIPKLPRRTKANERSTQQRTHAGKEWPSSLALPPSFANKQVSCVCVCVREREL